MHALLAISDGSFPDAAARAVLLSGGIDAREAPDFEKMELVRKHERVEDAARPEGVLRPDLLLVARPAAIADLLALVRELRANPLLEETAVILAVERRELALVLPGAGVDEVVCRPIDPHELLARIRFLLFRTRRLAGEGVVHAGDLLIDTRRYEVTLAGRRIDLTLKEYELLLFLAQHPGQVFTRDVLLDRIWGHAYFGGTRTVDVHVRRVRMKIERGAQEEYVETVRGVGYKFKG